MQGAGDLLTWVVFCFKAYLRVIGTWKTYKECSSDDAFALSRVIGHIPKLKVTVAPLCEVQIFLQNMPGSHGHLSSTISLLCALCFGLKKRDSASHLYAHGYAILELLPGSFPVVCLLPASLSLPKSYISLEIELRCISGKSCPVGDPVLYSPNNISSVFFSIITS
jgi:hypothetical protein